MLNLVPGEGQRLTAVTQAASLGAHASAGVFGDALLASGLVALRGLMAISCVAVTAATAIALPTPATLWNLGLGEAEDSSSLRMHTANTLV